MSQKEKFKPFRESVKPMIELSIESRLAELEKRIPENHLCRMVKEVVFSLDTSPIESCYSFEGQRSYHPRLMLSLFFYGYATGVRSSRKLENKCISDDYYKFLMHYYAEFKLMCIGWNIKKLLKLGFTPEMVKNL